MIDPEHLPDRDSDEFQRFIKRRLSGPGHPVDRFQPESSHCHTWKECPSPETHSSFGDKGTTACVNMFGEIMQFGTYLGIGNSGMFSADQGEIEEPYCGWERATDLGSLQRTRLSSIGKSTYGLQFESVNFEQRPCLKYLYYRWPRFEYRANDMELTVQWVVNDGLVLQQCVLTNLEDTEVQVPFKFRNQKESMWIRDLDYLDGTNDFNEEYNGYSQHTGPYGYSWRLIHQLKHNDNGSSGGDLKNEVDTTNTRTMKSKSEPDSIAVVVSVFLDGEALSWADTNERSWTRTLKGNRNRGDTMEVITAYKILPVKDLEVTWKDFLVPAALTDVDSILRNTPFSTFCLSATEKHTRSHTQGSDGNDEDQEIRRDGYSDPVGLPTNELSPSPHIEFVVRRNLEHILSVCSIPLRHPRLWDDCSSVEPPRIALTCGDIPCHRVWTSASFFAFRFLIEVASRLQTAKKAQPEDLYIKSLLERISEVCKGHMKWLLSLEVKKNLGYFVANYWVTGKATCERPWLPNDTFTDTAYQILKVREFTHLYNEEEDINLAKNAIMEASKSWIIYLEKQDRRACSVWPHAQQTGINIFRLDDQIWIWKAMKTIEDIGMWPRRENGEKVLRPLREIQQEILRRFTTENEASKKRMLAVTRSVRETRFLFHARDTALIYGYDWGILRQPAFQEVWENTLKVQSLHADQDTYWSGTLRYALELIIGVRESQANGYSLSDKTKSCLRTILQNTYLNGLCAGKLDETTKEPIMVEYGERDKYFHAGFEISCILLDYSLRIDRKYREQSRPPHAEDKRMPSRPSDFPFRPSTNQSEEQKTKPKSQQLLSDETTRNIVGSMKKTIPFSRLFDSNSVVELDEEGLYNYPSFLSRDTYVTDDDVSRMLPDLENHECEILVKGAKEAKERIGIGRKWFDDNDKTYRGVLVNIPKSKRRRKHKAATYTNLSRVWSNQWLSPLMLGSRSPISAKKRFIWLANANATTALTCYFGSCENDRPAVSQFLDRHWHHEVYFFDDTTRIANTWETELHLGFFRLLDAQELSLRDTHTLSLNILPGKGNWITKTSMGFHFQGDFFDRYWTCHFIEDTLVLNANMRNEKDEWKWYDHLKKSSPFPILDQEQGWRQRKVLELYLFDRMLNTLLKCTQEILSKVREELGIRQQQAGLMPSNLSSEDYFFSSVQWHGLQNVLQDMDENLDDVRLEVEKWETREKDRGREKPRWTRNDERKYGMIVKKALGTTEKSIRKLHATHASVKFLKETLIRSQEQIRQDIALRGSEDIRFFTYVTVVFLPLGFAASIFSMNGTPSPDLIASLVICAVVALVITVLALFNAKTLGYLSQRGFSVIDSYSRSKMARSVLIQENKTMNKYDEEAPRIAPDTRANSKGGPIKGVGESSYRPQTLGSEVFPRFWFLVVYTLLELPAKRVAMACRILMDGKLNSANSYLYVALGILFLPFCLITWLVQIAGYNAIDVLGIIFDFITSLGPSLSEELDINSYMRWLALPFHITLRPMKQLRSYLKDQRKLRKQKKEDERRQQQEKEAQEREAKEKDAKEKEAKEEKSDEQENTIRTTGEQGNINSTAEEQQLLPGSGSVSEAQMHGSIPLVDNPQESSNEGEGAEASGVEAGMIADELVVDIPT